MISGVTQEIGGATLVFRMTTGAMMRAESRLGLGVVQLIARMQSDPSVTMIVGLLGACADDGKGVPEERAAELVDALGFKAAVELLGRVMEQAFPDPEGNAAGADQTA